MKYGILFIFTLVVVCKSVFAQDIITMPDVKDRPVTEAHAIDANPKIDGEVRNDPVWLKIPAFSNLIQVRPNAGQPVSEKTDIRIAYTASTFYLSVVCFDAHPDQLVVSDARRDAKLDDTDAFLFILDTYHDFQNGFVFGTNSIGIEYDAQVDNEGQGNFNTNRQQGGIIGGFNLNWDGSWEVATQVGDYGWSAEFAIPLRTIRFNPGENQLWGFNAQRIIRKTNEVAYWASLPIEFDLKRLSLEGTLTNLNLKNPGNLKVIPYALGQVSKDFEQVPSNTKYDAEVGADVKYSVTPSLTLDLTYNTDFAQVEVDEQQINLDRFNLFFPEKRPFFLENAGLFSVGSPGEVDLFFSRRIGIGENGTQVPIIGGARLSGKVHNTSIGLLSMFTDRVDKAQIHPNNYSVVRINQQLASRSTIGGIFVNREGLDEISNDHNRTYAIDGKLGLGKKAQLSGFYAKTSTPGITSDDHAYKFHAQYQWNGLNLDAAYTEVANGFNPEVGFLQRTGFRKPEFLIFKRVRLKESSRILELRPHVSYRGFWNFQGFQETGRLHIDNHIEWKNRFEVHTAVNFTTEGVVQDFEISKGIIVQAGTYKHAEAQILFITNASKPVYLRTLSVVGGFFGGSRNAHTATVGLRIGDKFNSEFSLSHNDITVENGRFVTNIFRGRLTYSFTPSIFLQSLTQYNSVINQWSNNFRFSIIQQSNSGLFLVYNEARTPDNILNRSVILKYSRVIDVLK